MNKALLMMMMSSTGTPNGSTVTPVDDYTTWLRCAELPDTYGSLAAVIASSTAKTTLCNNLNALRYMVRSTSTIMPAVLADSGWLTALDSSTYAVAIPTMTSATAPSGIASASSYRTSADEIWKPYDKNTATYWFTAGGVATGWIMYQFASAIVPYKFRIYHNQSNDYTKNYQLLGSNNGSAFDTLKSGTLTATQDNMTTLVGASSYSYFKFDILTVNSNYCLVHEFNVYALNLA